MKILKLFRTKKIYMTEVYFCFIMPKANPNNIAAYTNDLNKKKWFGYMNDNGEWCESQGYLRLK